MVLYLAFSWLFDAVITSVISTAGFYCIAMAVDHAKTCYREKRQREEQMLREYLDCNTRQQLARRTFGVSRGASLFAAYKMSPNYLSCTANPRRRQSNAVPYNASRPAPYYRPFLWSVAQSVKQPRTETAMQTSADHAALSTYDSCPHCCCHSDKFPTRNTLFNQESGEHVRENVSVTSCLGTAKGDHNQGLKTASTQTSDSCAKCEMSRTRMITSKREKSLPSVRESRIQGTGHQSKTNSVVHRQQSGSRDSKSVTSSKKLWSRAVKEYPFIVPFLKPDVHKDIKIQISDQQHMEMTRSLVKKKTAAARFQNFLRSNKMLKDSDKSNKLALNNSPKYITTSSGQAARRLAPSSGSVKKPSPSPKCKDAGNISNMSGTIHSNQQSKEPQGQLSTSVNEPYRDGSETIPIRNLGNLFPDRITINSERSPCSPTKSPPPHRLPECDNTKENSSRLYQVNAKKFMQFKKEHSCTSPNRKALQCETISNEQNVDIVQGEYQNIESKPLLLDGQTSQSSPNIAVKIVNYKREQTRESITVQAREHAKSGAIVTLSDDDSDATPTGNRFIAPSIHIERKNSRAQPKQAEITRLGNAKPSVESRRTLPFPRNTKAANNRHDHVKKQMAQSQSNNYMWRQRSMKRDNRWPGEDSRLKAKQSSFFSNSTPMLNRVNGVANKDKDDRITLNDLFLQSPDDAYQDFNIMSLEELIKVQENMLLNGDKRGDNEVKRHELFSQRLQESPVRQENTTGRRSAQQMKSHSTLSGRTESSTSQSSIDRRKNKSGQKTKRNKTPQTKTSQQSAFNYRTDRRNRSSKVICSKSGKKYSLAQNSTKNADDKLDSTVKQKPKPKVKKTIKICSTPTPSNEAKRRNQKTPVNVYVSNEESDSSQDCASNNMASRRKVRDGTMPRDDGNYYVESSSMSRKADAEDTLVTEENPNHERGCFLKKSVLDDVIRQLKITPRVTDADRTSGYETSVNERKQENETTSVAINIVRSLDISISSVVSNPTMSNPPPMLSYTNARVFGEGTAFPVSDFSAPAGSCEGWAFPDQTMNFFTDYRA